MNKPTFERLAGATLARVADTFGQRGTEYGDTMRDCQWLAMKAVAARLGYKIQPEHFRALCIAGFVDMKYQRLQGGYKEDSVVDGIAYAGFLAEDMRLLALPKAEDWKPFAARKDSEPPELTTR
jgi:hypothetical protein